MMKSPAAALASLSRRIATACMRPATLVVLGLASADASPLTVNAASRSGTLTKAGLGSLFGAASIAGGTSRTHLENSLLYVTQSQGRIGENGSNPYSTEAVAPVIRGTGVKMMCRFNDLCHGWPYIWPGYTAWINEVNNATTSIKNNYADVVYAIAIFNEPDAQLFGSDFITDPLVGGGTNHDARINWLWTQSYKAIRAIAPNIKIMGPSYFDYRPQADGAHQTRMRNFMINAVATNTVPDVMGWHSLVFGNPQDVTTALNNYYRPLEIELNVPGAPLPISIEEYGINNGAFEGVPGQMVRYWAEFERARIDFACMGIYENGASIGNTIRYAWDVPPVPNAGWHMLNWYRTMAGEKVAVTRSTFDGVSTWNPATSELTVVFGGSTENSTVQINGLGTLGLGTQVRVRFERAEWSLNSNVANDSVNQGGDPLTEPRSIYDRTFSLDGSGNLAVPVRLENNYEGYRIIVSPVAASASYTGKYEAENATIQHAVILGGTAANPRASGTRCVGGIDFADSSVSFDVTAPAAGLYRMSVRYAAATGAATHLLSVNGTSQGTVDYTATAAGWSNNELRMTSRLVALRQGANQITFAKGTLFAELDYIDIRADPHRYQAKLATVNNLTLGKYANMFMVPDFAGGINDTDSYVEFSVEAPVAGDYQLSLVYGNGTTGNAVDSITINGTARGNVTLLPTGGWLSAAGGPGPKRKTVKTVQALDAGWNTVRVQKVSGFAELDYLTIAPYLPEQLAQPLWTGVINGAWNNTTENWKDSVSGNSGIFVNPAPVVFNDTATGTTTITLDQTVSPGSVTFNNSTKSYSLSGSGGIGGTNGLVKQGTQSLSLAVSNTYTGVTTLSGGTTTATLLSNGGAASSIGAAPAAAANLVLNGGTLSYTGMATTIDRGFTLTAAGSGISTTNALTMAGPVANNSGSLIKGGAGNLTLSYNGALSLGSVSPAVRVQQGTLTLSGSGAQAASVTGEFWVASQVDVPADLTVANSSLSVSSFLALGRANGNDGLCRFTATGSTLQTASFSTGYGNGLANNASEQIVTIDNTTWNNTTLTYLAESTGSTATMTLQGNSRYNTGGNTLLARLAGTQATLTLKGTAAFTASAGYISIGTAGTGTLQVQENAVFTGAPNSDFNVGDTTGSSGTLTISNNGSIVATQVYIGKNNGSSGTVNQSGGSFQSASFISIGRFAGGSGSVNVSGGTFTQNGATNPLYVGEQGTGILTIASSGSVVAQGTGLLIGGGGSGTVSLNGGTLTAKQVTEGAGGTSAFYFNGGVLKAAAGANASFLTGLDSAVVKPGGAFIDTNGQSLTIAQNLTDNGGGLTKQGTGTLLLNGTNTYSGTTTVTAGRLGGTGSITGPLNVTSVTSLAPGTTVGTFTTGATTIAGTYLCDVSGTTADKLAVNGTLTLTPGAVLDFNTITAPSGPALVIASYTSLSGTFSVQHLPAGYHLEYAYNDGTSSNRIALVVGSGNPYDTWTSLYFPGVTDPAIIGTTADPDKDGSPNSLEFALGGIPNNPADGPKVFQFVADSSDPGTDKELLITIAVRGTPTFGAGPAPSVTSDGFIYQIRGGLNPGAFTAPVSEVSPIPPPAPNSTPPPGYSWRTFSLDGSNNLPSKGFLRVSVEKAS